MEPISSNSPVRANQVQVQQNEQTDQQRQEETAPQPRADSFTATSPVSELQLQRSQVVEDLGRVQQARESLEGAEPSQDVSQQLNVLNEREQRISSDFNESENNIDEQQAQQLSDQLQREIQEQPNQAVAAQASNVSEQTSLTLFQ